MLGEKIIDVSGRRSHEHLDTICSTPFEKIAIWEVATRRIQYYYYPYMAIR